MITALTSLTILGVVLGLILGVAARVFRWKETRWQQNLVAILPGSQCGQCGFPGCAGAAQALAEGHAPVTLCPPGGRAVALALAAKLGRDINLAGVERNLRR